MMRIQKSNGVRQDMFWPVAGVLAFIWVLGLMSGHTMGGWLHLLPALALVMVLVRFSQGHRPA